MSSNRQRGNGAEKRAQEALEQEGYLVHRAVQTSFQRAGVWRSHDNDIFSLFDLVAVHPSFPVRFVQVTAGDSSAASARRRKVLALAEHFPLRHADLEVWRWHGGGKRLDPRFDNTVRKHFRRRQYFSIWALESDGWQDVTPREAGWVDGYVPVSVGPGDVGPAD